MAPSDNRGRRSPSGGAGRASEKLARFLAAASSSPSPPGGRRGVLADTCAWIDYFRGDGGRLAESLDEALRSEPVHTCGQVLLELIQGAAARDEKSILLNALGALDYLEMRPQTWINAGEISALLRHRGKTIPFSDLLMAALAIEHGLTLLTRDKHFEEIPGLKLRG